MPRLAVPFAENIESDIWRTNRRYPVLLEQRGEAADSFPWRRHDRFAASERSGYRDVCGLSID